MLRKLAVAEITKAPLGKGLLWSTMASGSLEMESREMFAQSQRVNVSMVSLKWGDVLSMLLPGAVALYAIAPYFPQLQERINEIFDRTGQSAPGTAFTLTL